MQYPRPIIPTHQLPIPFLSASAKLSGLQNFSPSASAGQVLVVSDDYVDRSRQIMFHADKVGRRSRTLLKDIRFSEVINTLLCSAGAYDSFQSSCYSWILLSYYICSGFKDRRPQDLALQGPNIKVAQELIESAASLCSLIKDLEALWMDPDHTEQDDQYLSEVDMLFCSDKVTPLGAPSEQETALAGIDFALPFEGLRNDVSYFRTFESESFNVIVSSFREAITGECDPVRSAKIFRKASMLVTERSKIFKNELLGRLREVPQASGQFLTSFSRVTGARPTTPGQLLSAGDAAPVMEEMSAEEEDMEPVKQNTGGPSLNVKVSQ